jgi:sugar lactone lactonase YvrE
VYTFSGDLYVVDIPYGRILRIDANKKITVEAEWDGEPNGLAVDPEGKIAIADYKQVYRLFDDSIDIKLNDPRVF